MHAATHAERRYHVATRFAADIIFAPRTVTPLAIVVVIAVDIRSLFIRHSAHAKRMSRATSVLLERFARSAAPAHVSALPKPPPPQRPSRHD